jgi:DNA-binding NarL/FixJ family response regulator
MICITRMAAAMHVLVIDRHPIVFEGCKQLLDSGLTRIHYTPTLAAGFRHCREDKPDVIVMELKFGHWPLAGILFIKRFRRIDPTTPILVFSMQDDPLLASQVLQSGASGYLPKDSPVEEIATALAKLSGGKAYLSHRIASSIVFIEAARRANPARALTPLESKILSLLAEGNSYDQIAATLLTSYKTVANVTARLKAKLGAGSLAQLMQIALQQVPPLARRRFQRD